MEQTIISDFFSFTDVLSAIAWLILLSGIVYMKSLKLESKRFARIYIINFVFKIFFCLAFILTYLLIFNGGDTTAYWKGAECIQNLISESPITALEHFFTTPARSNYREFFNQSTGFPPIWIYIEPESYFVCKITAILSLFCFKSYLAASFIFAFILAEINWKIYRITLTLNLFTEKYVHFAILFIPSVSFWCAGVSKDTVILISFYYLFFFVYSILYLDKKKSVTHWLGVLFFLYIIYRTRNFMLLPIVIPFFVSVGILWLKKNNISPILQVPINILIASVIIGASTLYLSSESGTNLIANNGFIKEAIVVQQDFKHNLLYGKNQYSIGDIDNTPIGILKSIPISVFSGIYKPLPWNGLSSSLILNAIESLLLIFLTLKIIITGNLYRWVQVIRKNEILVFCVIFVFIIAFMAGFTSIIYGVLVRIRAPLLPLFALLLLLKLNKKSNFKNYSTEPIDQPIAGHSLK